MRHFPSVVDPKRRKRGMKNFKFFVFSDGVVQGPLQVQDFDPKPYLSKDSGAQFWTQGLDSWCPLQDFAAFARAVEETETNPSTRQWYLKIADHEQGPLSRWQLERRLSRLPDLSAVTLRTAERAVWQSVYDFLHIVEELGISQRKIPRAAVVGQVLFKRGQEVTSAQARTLSENGVGVLCQESRFAAGQIYHLTLDLPHFDQPLVVQGEILYHSENGEVGVLFHSLSAEARAKIVSFVKHYSELLLQQLAAAA